MPSSPRIPALHKTAATGPVIREAQRHLVQWTLKPISELIAERASAKQGGAIAIYVMRPFQPHDAGGKARALPAMIGALVKAKEAGIEGSTL